MAKCLTCGRVADRQAAVCNGCGRPNPTTPRRGEIVLWVIGAGFLGVVLLIGSHSKDALTVPAGTGSEASLPPIPPSPVDQEQGVPQPVAPAGTPILARFAPMGAGEDVVATGIDATDRSAETEAAAPLAAVAVSGGFPRQARLVDPRGKVVVQSGPSLFSKNVATLQAGETVRASAVDGKWVEVLLGDGRTGFVRHKQLAPFVR